MRKFAFILFIIHYSLVIAQADTLGIDNGKLPDEIFIKGYSNENTFGRAHFYGGIDLTIQNKIIYNSSDSSLFSGIIHSYNNPEKRYDRSSLVVSFDEYFCIYNQGIRVNCNSFTYYKRGYNRHDTVNYVPPKPHLSTIKKNYYSNDGSKIDSAFHYGIRDRDQSTSLTYSYIYDEQGNLAITEYNKHDTLFHGKYTEDNKPYGVWINSIFTRDTVIKVSYLFKNGELIDVLDNNCLFISKKNEILEESSFFNEYSNLRLNDFHFIAIRDLLIPLTDDYDLPKAIKHEYFGDYELILTANDDYSSYYEVPKRVIRKLIRKYKKRHTTQN